MRLPLLEANRVNIEAIAMNSLPSLNIPEELIVMLLNEQTGYFYQVEGWTLNCVIIGAVLADLSLKSRIDTDEESLFLIDSTKTGEPILDLCLEEIGRVGGWRASFRVRWLIRRFRSGPQSGSRTRVSKPPLIKPDVQFSRIRLSDEIMPSPSESPQPVATGEQGRRRHAASCPRSARISRTSPCASGRATCAAAGPRVG